MGRKWGARAPAMVVRVPEGDAADRWILMGVSALAARFWAYHRLYDDVLVVLPAVALFRIAERGWSADGSDVAAGIWLALLVLIMLVPARLGFENSRFVGLYNAGHALTWLAVLCFLLRQARRQYAPAYRATEPGRRH